MSTNSTLKILLALILLLSSVLIGTLALAMARQEGQRWTVAIRQGAIAFGGTGTLGTGIYAAFISIP